KAPAPTTATSSARGSGIGERRSVAGDLAVEVDRAARQPGDQHHAALEAVGALAADDRVDHGGVVAARGDLVGQQALVEEQVEDLVGGRVVEAELTFRAL